MTASQLILITSNTTTIERLNILRKEHFRKFHKRGDKESQGVAAPATSPSPSRRAEYSSKNKWDNKYNLGTYINAHNTAQHVYSPHKTLRGVVEPEASLWR